MKSKRKRPSRFRQLASFSLSVGQHSGKPIGKVPVDYLEWLLTTEGPDLAADRWVAKQFLKAINR